MKYINYYEWNLEELVDRSQIEVNNMINAFKETKFITDLPRADYQPK